MVTCIFCLIAAHRAPATIVHEWPDAVAIEAVPGCTKGHLLVFPHVHVATALVDERVTGRVMQLAAELANRLGITDCQLWFNVGRWGGQTVDHVHGHLVPRSENDGLRFAAWEWSQS